MLLYSLGPSFPGSDGGTGRRSGFKIHRSQGHVSSILTPSTLISYLFMTYVQSTGVFSADLSGNVRLLSAHAGMSVAEPQTFPA